MRLIILLAACLSACGGQHGEVETRATPTLATVRPHDGHSAGSTFDADASQRELRTLLRDARLADRIAPVVLDSGGADAPSGTPSTEPEVVTDPPPAPTVVYVPQTDVEAIICSMPWPCHEALAIVEARYAAAGVKMPKEVAQSEG